MVGSACFALGAVPAYLDLVGVEADGVTFFVGSLFFTSAARRCSLWPWSATDPGAVQWRPALPRRPSGGPAFAGTLLFNVSTFARAAARR